jgi:hypothetical protein
MYAARALSIIRGVWALETTQLLQRTRVMLQHHPRGARCSSLALLNSIHGVECAERAGGLVPCNLLLASVGSVEAG